MIQELHRDGGEGRECNRDSFTLDQVDGVCAEQPSFKSLRVDPTAKATAMSETATVRSKILENDLDQARKVIESNMVMGW